jgi:MoxR-like ATPase
VTASDLWVLRYVWDREEQIAPLASLINGVLEQHRDAQPSHPLSAPPERIEGEELARQFDVLERELQNGRQSLTALARLRERAAELADLAAWVTHEQSRKHLLDRAGKILERLG